MKLTNCSLFMSLPLLRIGYARRKHRENCRKIVSLVVSLRIDKYNEKKITLEPALKETSEYYRSLKYESFRAVC